MTDEEIRQICLETLRTTPGQQMGLVQLASVCERHAAGDDAEPESIPLRRMHAILSTDRRFHVAANSVALVV